MTKSHAMTMDYALPKDGETKNNVVRRASLAGGVGSFVEWYDYGIYGLLVSSLVLVFSASDMNTTDAGLMLTYVGFTVSFIVRPFGGVICGYLGDRIGRQKLLAILLLMISLATAAIGLLPDYNSIGWAAPALLILLRIVQGFSAGGEVSGAGSFVAEYAEDHRRAVVMSPLVMGSFIALLFGSLLISGLINVFGIDAVNNGLWRVPFLLAIPMALIGVYIRTRIEDTPHFQMVKASKRVVRNPIREVLSSKRHLKAIGLAITLPAVNGPGYYILFVYMPTYLNKVMHFTQIQSLMVTACGLLTIVGAIPLMAWLSDRLGRRPLLIASAIAMAVLAWPCFWLLTLGMLPLACMASMLLAFAFAGHAGVIQATLAEMFPTNVRYSAYSIGFNLSTVIFGGSAPLLMTWLIGMTGIASIPSYMVIFTAALTLISALYLKETAGQPLRAE
ncbi:MULTISPECIES: MFS transporter [Erwinia]|uniref:MFS transporter n=1 Tax=Erwinia rhapontici TaxID=55212 RepID=A0ABN6DJP3_ERWRD|nr:MULTISPECIES: MFS transporter [Erwinia]MBP2155801.1 MHS family proline/betaine transporter-like MFS transporter [Erwinia rhapontici]MCS3606081.1 MHS family proline/betaine transporter-like MFS transporter [Erwinia rhapontici]NNS05786.1 MFS transporter [Erwinia sp. JH02]TDS92855.1 MHS family proline/betaine transporter-like MFS transporter [Erwinia rhapontici]BCQ34948.1 MFS transporter [Erwinia rhapontici]